MIGKGKAGVVSALKGFYTTHNSAFNGVLEKLPEALWSGPRKAKDSLNGREAHLPPIDQVVATQNSASVSNSLGEADVRMQEHATSQPRAGHSQPLSELGHQDRTYGRTPEAGRHS